MRCYKVLPILLILLVLLTAGPLPLEAQEERLVLAFYYAWFDFSTWSLPLSDQPATPYLSADPATIESHILQAKQAGIDALVLNWYGPQVDNNQTETNMQILLDKASAHGLQASLTVDIAGPFINNLDDLVSALVAVRDRHAAHPAYLQVAGRPVVFFWREEQYSVDTWLALRQQIDPTYSMLWIAEGTHPEYLAAFDGLYLYSVAWTADPASALIRWGGEVEQWGQAQGSFRYWVATVMPGYNDFPTGRSDAFARDRQGGAYYRACWAGAMQSDADWVVITSFNEWLEGTQIEPAQSYGNFYLDLTAELAAQYRQIVGTSEDVLESPTATATLEPTAVLATFTPLPPTPAEAPLPTATVTMIPTATLLPTATYFRLPTPTLTIPLERSAEVKPEEGLTSPDDLTPGLPDRRPIQGAKASRSSIPYLVGLLVFLLTLLIVEVFVFRHLLKRRR